MLCSVPTLALYLFISIAVFYNHFFSICLKATDYIFVNGLPLIFIILHTTINVPKLFNNTVFVLNML